MAFDDGIKVGPIAYIGLVSVIGMVALVLLLQVLYYQVNDQLQQANAANQGPPKELTTLLDEQRTALMERGYVNREQGIVKIGIERAKELVVKELAAGKTPRQVIGPEPSPPAQAAAKSAAGKESATAKIVPKKQDASKKDIPKKTNSKNQSKKKQESKDDATS